MMMIQLRLDIRRIITVNMTIPPIPNSSRPILAALGTPSSTDPMAQAALNNIEAVPTISPERSYQGNGFLLAYMYRKNPEPTVNIPNTYQVKLII
jgi:hypothetical protein